jgi:excisionase family DNA binding protein
VEGLIKLQDAAKRLGISRSRLYALASQGKVPCVRIGGQGRLMFREEDIAAQLRPRQSQPTQTLEGLHIFAEAADIDAQEPSQPPQDEITPAEMEAMLRAAFKALAEVRAKAKLRTEGD